ncbi:MAG: phosphoribosylaminoimidazolesuccinocarboxamide synthase [Candidatus Calescibacterium sp.]|nr:phosphoribosylaminoimidazolesuccinocarboxamide synthase [Candidatus Calescibacterium sp.]MCX7733974.1 phosphoribosylaminoimidazolesuccinocarboxamide synthase [bacterium]MDW8086427.1 phosphoribosylaminoimidazolesuccinocarboxamide synthase [Candidatus Calescibacterium sp.]
MGSVKDVELLRPPTESRSGEGIFLFSDRFSVFDWGVMPDLIDGKGKSICIIGAWFFEKLQDLGLKTHYIGVLDDGKVKNLKDVVSPPYRMLVKFLRVIKPKLDGKSYDYSDFKKQDGNFVIPLEVIYRNSLPAGSSVFRRLKEGKISLADIGLDEFPKENTKLKSPIIDFSTKFESQDRYISQDEAKSIAGLKDKEFEKIKEYTLIANKVITEAVERISVSNEDGKFEFGFDENRQIIFVDVIGTPDECRFMYDGIQVSKEVLRSYYRKTDWYEKLVEAKSRDFVKWRELVGQNPPTLPNEIKKLVSELYMSFCNEITQRDWFKVRSFKDVVKEVKSYFG